MAERITITERWETEAVGRHSDGTYPTTTVAVEYPAGNAWNPYVWGRLHVRVAASPERWRCLTPDGGWVDIPATAATPDDVELGLPVPNGFLPAMLACRSAEIDDLKRQLADADAQRDRAYADADRYRMLADTAAQTVDGLRVLLQMAEVATELDGPVRRSLEAVVDGGD